MNLWIKAADPELVEHIQPDFRLLDDHENHRMHGKDAKGVLVHTPDEGLIKHGHKNGWWKPGEVMTGMPYQWGGFDTPRHLALVPFSLQHNIKGDLVRHSKTIPSPRYGFVLHVPLCLFLYSALSIMFSLT